MFKRVQFEEWQAIITVVAFFIFFLAFLFVCWRAVRMSKKDQNHLSNLPLESDNPTEPTSHERSEK